MTREKFIRLCGLLTLIGTALVIVNLTVEIVFLSQSRTSFNATEALYFTFLSLLFSTAMLLQYMGLVGLVGLHRHLVGRILAIGSIILITGQFAILTYANFNHEFLLRFYLPFLSITYILPLLISFFLIGSGIFLREQEALGRFSSIPVILGVWIGLAPFFAVYINTIAFRSLFPNLTGLRLIILPLLLLEVPVTILWGLLGVALVRYRASSKMGFVPPVQR